MDLFIYTGATDKTQAAVVSATSTTPITNFPQMTLGDVPLLNVYFTNGTAYESWSGAVGYTLTVGIGTLDTGGQAAYTSSTAFSNITNGWSGRLNLNTLNLINALSLQVGSAVDWTRFPTQARVPYPRFALGYFYLQIQVTDPSGYPVTYAELRIPILNRVLPDGAATTQTALATLYAFLRASYVQNRYLVGIAATSEDSTLLCGIPTFASMYSGCKILAGFPNDIEVLFEFVATTSTSAGFLFAPYDYNATTNPFKWKVRGVWNLGVPCLYDADTTKWHYIVAMGAANAVTVGVDQTGFSLPT